MTFLSTKYFVLYSIAMDVRHVGVIFEEFTFSTRTPYCFSNKLAMITSNTHSKKIIASFKI